MGLAITAYSYLLAVGDHTNGERCDLDDHIAAFADESFPRSLAGVPILRRKSRRLWGGCYAPTEATETHWFGAGSYSGYSTWRDDLRAQFNPTTNPDGPFFELIWFDDDQGTIGPAAAAELLADFQDPANAYRPAHDPRCDRCCGNYANWTRAFELAARGGLVSFH